MNARLVKLTLTLCSLSLLNFTGALQAQDTNTEDVTAPPGYAGRRGALPPGYRGSEGTIEDSPIFNIQIENGSLSLAPLKGSPERNPWGTNAFSVPATVDNLSKYLRAVDPHLNIVLSPEVGNVTIPNLKLNTRTPISISQAVSVASGGTILGPSSGGGAGMFGGGLRGGERSLTFVGSRNRESKSSVEVFNLSGYIQSLGKMDEDMVRQKLDDLQTLIVTTLKSLPNTKDSSDLPDFKYHSGTKLFIVIGKPEAIDVTRKIVNALSGQQKNGMVDVTVPPDQN